MTTPGSNGTDGGSAGSIHSCEYPIYNFFAYKASRLGIINLGVIVSGIVSVQLILYIVS